MKIIYNSIVPFEGFLAINLFGVLFVRKGKKLKDTTINHEEIHTALMKELLYIPFYIIYVLEWIYRLIFTKTNNAYRDLSFEKEAYNNERNAEYLLTRKCFAQWRKKK